MTRFLFEFRNKNKRKRRKVKKRKLGKLEIIMGENPSFFTDRNPNPTLQHKPYGDK